MVFQCGLTPPNVEKYSFFEADGFAVGNKTIGKSVAEFLAEFFSAQPDVCAETWPFALEITVYGDYLGIIRYGVSTDKLTTEDSNWQSKFKSWFGC